MRRSAKTPDQLGAAIKLSRPGDIIDLAGGDYGAFGFDALTFPDPGVTIQALDGARVVFSTITANGASGLTLRGLEVLYNGPGNAITANGAKGLKLEGLNIHGPPGGRNGVGVSLRDTTNVTLTKSKIHDIGAGVVHLNAQRTLIEDVDVRDLRGDGITGASAYVTVRNVRLTNFYPGEGDHPDAIQFWGETPGIVVEGNVYTRGAGQPVQGVFVERAQGITIRGNALLGTMYNGISLSGVEKAVVEDNFVQGYTDMPTRIIVRDKSTDISVIDNVSQQTVEYAGPNPNLKMSRNTSIKAAKVGDATALDAWLQRKKGAQLEYGVPLAALAAGVVVAPSNRRGALGQMLAATVGRLVV